MIRCIIGKDKQMVFADHYLPEHENIICRVANLKKDDILHSFVIKIETRLKEVVTLELEYDNNLNEITLSQFTQMLYDMKFYFISCISGFNFCINKEAKDNLKILARENIQGLINIKEVPNSSEKMLADLCR